MELSKQPFREDPIMPFQRLANFILLPGLKLKKWVSWQRYYCTLICESSAQHAVCPKCQNVTETIYDRRRVVIKDAPVRATLMRLSIEKKRFFCHSCGRPFTERLDGILPQRRTTQRYRASLLWACENFSDLKRVKKLFRCSNGFLYSALHEQLDLTIRKNRYPWPTTIGIDEHSFQRRRPGREPFATMIIDYNHKKPFEIVNSKQTSKLMKALEPIPERQNVYNAIIDLSDSYRAFIRKFFPSARIIADKFHVLRLLNPAIQKYQRDIPRTMESLRMRKLLLMNAYKLDPFAKSDIITFLNQHPQLKELWLWKEKLYTFYRIKGIQRARWVLYKLIEDMKNSQLPEIQTLWRTLNRWATAILHYFSTGLTNARTEGFNNLAKLIKRRGFGYRNFENYRRRVLCACF